MGKPKLIYSVISPFFFFSGPNSHECRRSGVGSSSPRSGKIFFIFFIFFLTKWYESIYILDPEVEPIPNIKFVFGYDHSGSFPPKSCVRGQLWAAILDWSYYRKWPIFNPPSYFFMDYMMKKEFFNFFFFFYKML